jgi:hypothetical protein
MADGKVKVSKTGQKMDFHADPKTGVITFEKLDD